MYDTQRKLWHRQDTVEVMDFVRQDGVMLLLCRDGRLLDTAGEVGTKETNVVWSAESGDLGLYTPEHKYLARLELRMKLEEGAVVKAFVRYDNGETLGTGGDCYRDGGADQGRGDAAASQTVRTPAAEVDGAWPVPGVQRGGGV